ncbi:tetratricopeptide repeat protein [Pararhodonellum marinum]|uniref:tetratricopeptide repeat protein n=1 Tax=Pararhodonellum marinum TaxID=2755358 RepID=UPI0018909B23|nr:tetratricopeptide repeat protein [Pararhodonellum marinum]
MRKSQILLLVLAVTMVVVLFALPTVVVDNDEGNTNFEETSGTPSAQETPDIHDSPLPEGASQQIRNWRSAMELEESSEKFATFADSIASQYASAGKFDSSAYYYGLTAEKFPQIENWEKAGNAYYEAFGFALNEEKVVYLAGKTRDYLNKVLEKDPERLDLKTKVAMTYVSSSNPMQGITMLREVLEQDPRHELALFNMGILSMQSGQYKRASERFEELVDYHPENMQGQFYLGVSYFESKQKNKAKKQFQKVKDLTQDPMILTSVDNYLQQL